MKAVRFWWLGAGSLAAVIAIAACSGGSGVTPSASAGIDAAAPQVPPARVIVKGKKRGQARIVVEIPRKKKHGRRMNPKFISPSTQSMTVAVKGQATQTFNLTPAQCATNPSTGYLTCSNTLFLPKGSQTLTIALYDRQNGKGDVLSTASTAVKIAAGAVTNISITLDGVVATAVVLLGSPPQASLAIPEGTATTVPMTVSAYDAKGNLIMSPGNYTSAVALANSDASGATTLNATSVTGPTTVVSLAYNGAALSSTTITPSVGSGSQPAGAATLTLTAPTMTEYSLSYGSSPYGITSGPDNALWFTESGSNQIGRITTGGTITQNAVTTSGSGPEGIALGPDSALWFAELHGDKIGRIATDGTINEYSIPTAFSFSPHIAAGPDGAMWFTECSGNNIGRITTDGKITEFPVKTAAAGPYDITAGADGALWFTEELANQIGRITTGGIVTEYSVPTAGSTPYGITAGPDGALWFAEYGGNKIGRITTDGQFTEYTGLTASSRPNYITEGSDGALWFTEITGDNIGRITTAGSVTEYSVPTGSSTPNGITSGPDGALWFTEYSANKIGRVPTSIVMSSSARRHR